LLHDAGLTKYYELGGGEGHPVELLGGGGLEEQSTDHKWLEPFVARIAKSGAAPLSRVVLDVQGLHCSACVWLFEKLFARCDGAAKIEVNPAIGSVELTIASSFPLATWVTDIESFGYRLGPPLKSMPTAGSDGENHNSAPKTSGNDLVWRMGICIAIAMNTMIFGFAIYCGLEEGRVYRLFHALDFALSIVSILVGGSVFFRSAYQALRRRVLHLDLPIALGIAFVFVSSTYTYATRGGATSYFDTLNVFIALMLVGRFLQERVLAKNRAMLLQSNGAEGIYTRRANAQGIATIRCTAVELGDILILARGDIVPVESVLLEDEPALFSLDWINGESAPRTFEPGATIPAGAFSHGARAIRVQARAPFEESHLVSLLRTSTHRDRDVARATSWHTRLTRVYVAAVLSIAAAGSIGWLIATHGDVPRTLDVVAAILIVTCPCAFGIATPLAYELAQGALRRVGLYVRTPGFLDRAAEVRRVVFDKTGTLTTGRLRLTSGSETALRELSVDEREKLYALAARSGHPKSRAITATLEIEKTQLLGAASSFQIKASVDEILGKGLELVATNSNTGACDRYRLGAPAWALATAEVPRIGDHTADADVLFTRNGELLAAFETTEELRVDARDEVAALKKLGYEIFVLSGDALEPTKALARSCGIDAELHTFGGRSPEEKAQWMRLHRHRDHQDEGHAKMLFVGDGINDSLVAEEAYCAGTPAIDRPFMAARSDFYFVTSGLRPIRYALLAAKRLARTVRLNLLVALFYNAITLSFALAGLMTPLLCAVLMPVSSLSTVLLTTTLMRKNSVAAQNF